MRRPFCYWHSNTDVDENIHFGQSYDFGFYNYNGRLERFFQCSIFLNFKTQYAACGITNFYSPGFVTRDRRIGSWQAHHRIFLGTDYFLELYLIPHLGSML
jgi:hypothetical protein